MIFKKDTYCSYCGTKFAEQIIYPRKCYMCYNDTFKDPEPTVPDLKEGEND